MSAKRLVSRRSFLRGAVAVAAAPYVLPSVARGRSAPSERITLGMIGTGQMGKMHISPLLHNPAFQVVAVCDVKKWERDAAKRRLDEGYGHTRGGIDSYHSYEDVLARDDIDAVLIAVPDHWHAIIAIAACQAGKDVYCEKPLSLTIHEADEMVRAARRYGRVFQTGSQQRSADNFRRACALVRSGRIGRITRVNVGVGEPSQHKVLPEEPMPEGIDWDRWLGPTPWYPYNSERCSGSFGGGWRFIRDTSGGMMTDWGAHHFDIAQWGLGMDGTGPVEIIPPSAAEDGRLTYIYANGIPMFRGGANGILFTGTDGEIEVNRGHFRASPASVAEEPLGPGDEHLYRSPGHHQDFADCVRARRRPICDVAVGASSATVCHLGNIAWWLGRKLRWDPKKHVIVGDETANRWIDRPRRAPYRLHA